MIVAGNLTIKAGNSRIFDLLSSFSILAKISSSLEPLIPR